MIFSELVYKITFLKRFPQSLTCPSPIPVPKFPPELLLFFHCSIFCSANSFRILILFEKKSGLSSAVLTPHHTAERHGFLIFFSEVGNRMGCTGCTIKQINWHPHGYNLNFSSSLFVSKITKLEYSHIFSQDISVCTKS